MPDTLRLENRTTDATSLVCPHCLRDVSLPSDEPFFVDRDKQFQPKLVAFPCPLCTELIRLDN
jgi:predicted RNA-binding Zn-ribbon protein involved in translation (DUF1610 family)